MTETAVYRRRAHLAALFARYIKGEIEEPLWKRFMSILEATETQPQERMAVIAFMHDFLVERSRQALQLASLFSDESALRPAYCRR